MPTILKGFHRPLLPTLGLLYKPSFRDYEVTFTDSCQYYLPGADMLDTNKLFGVGYFPHHHKESARFGWRSLRKGVVLLSAYCYSNGERVIKDLCEVKINKPYHLHLYICSSAYFFSVVDKATKERIGYYLFERDKPKMFGYPLGLYFGGNKTAPHSITVKMKRL